MIMIMSVKFYNDSDSIVVNISDCMKLELKLNKDEMYKNKWESLGDILYSWGSGTNYKNLMNNEFLAEQEKIDWLRNNLK